MMADSILLLLTNAMRLSSVVELQLLLPTNAMRPSSVLETSLAVRCVVQYM
jgi:hypothetical protein